jgi:adenine phosphoribosyltransferase
MAVEFQLDKAIRKIHDFPKKGILYFDITSILTNPEAFSYCLKELEKRAKPYHADAIAAVESRGFIFAAPLALAMGLPLILIRKKGKLPGKTVSQSYSLEYGQAEIEIHEADIPKGKRIIVIDDLIATGGTLNAACKLFSQNGAFPVAALGVIGLPFLHFQKALGDLPVETLIDYHGE